MRKICAESLPNSPKMHQKSHSAKKIPEKLFVGKTNVGLSLDAPSLLVGSKSDVNTI